MLSTKTGGLVGGDIVEYYNPGTLRNVENDFYDDIVVVIFVIFSLTKLTFINK